MTKKKAETEKKKTLRDTLRGMSPGMSMTIEVDKPGKLYSIRLATSYLNKYEPDLDVMFSCSCRPAERKAIITARKREKQP